LAAKDFERAAELVEGHAMQMLKRGEMTALLGWLETLPAAAIQSRSQLCIYQAWALALSGRPDEVERSLQAAESGPEADLSDDRSGQIAAIRSYVAGQQGEIGRAVELAQQALALLDEGNLVVRSVVAFTLGGVHLVDGDLACASRALAQASEMGQVAGNVHLAVPASTMLADLEVQQGQPHRAFDAYRQALEVAGHLPVAAQAHSGMGMVSYEWNDLESAAHHLARSIELGQLWGNVDALSSDYIALAQIRCAQGDLSGANDAVQEATRLAEGTRAHPAAVARVTAGRLRLAVIQGDLAAVERWVRDCDLDLEGDVNPFREAEYTTLARALLALGQADAASRLLARLLKAVEKDGRLGRGIEILVLQALAHHAQGDRDQALTTLTRAVALAEPEEYLRTFLDEGEPLQCLLSDLRSRLQGQVRAADDPDPQRLLAYIDELLAAFAAAEPKAIRADKVARGSVAGTDLAEPLSERELEVLRLVAAGLTNQAIADQLFIALSTVKSHTNSIYGKLGVQNRTQAIAQARALGLL
jgi:LuxR family maltose regulon positive regulatory protein